MTRLLLRSVTVLGLVIFANSCSPASGSGVIAQEVSPPSSGVRCFAILQDGKAVGGNCVLK